MRVGIFLIGATMVCGITPRAQSLERQTAPADFNTTCHRYAGHLVCKMPIVQDLFVQDLRDESTVQFCLKGEGEHAKQICYTMPRPQGARISEEEFARQQKLLQEELKRRAEEARKRLERAQEEFKRDAEQERKRLEGRQN